MGQFSIREIVTYEIEAETKEEALQKFLNADNLDIYLRDIEERTIEDGQTGEIDYIE